MKESLLTLIRLPKLVRIKKSSALTIVCFKAEHKNLPLKHKSLPLNWYGILFVRKNSKKNEQSCWGMKMKESLLTLIRLPKLVRIKKSSALTIVCFKAEHKNLPLKHKSLPLNWYGILFVRKNSKKK